MATETTPPEPDAGPYAAPVRPGAYWRRRFVPGPVAMALLLLSLAGMIVVGSGLAVKDASVANLIVFSLCIVCCVTLLVWFAFFSAYARLLRWMTLLVATAIAAQLRIDHFSGDMVPVFRSVWSTPADRGLESPAVASGLREVDLSTTGPHDFPQFLGPRRDNRVTGIELARDWERNPPREFWRQPIGAGWSAFAAVNGSAVTMEQRGDEELVTCYEIDSGQLQWAHSLPVRHSTVMGGVGPRSTPTIHDGKVYALGASGVLCCLDGASGAPLWRVDLPARFGATAADDLQAVAWGRAASPLVVDNLVVTPLGGPAGGPFVSLLALDKLTGEPVWEGGDRQVSYSSPNVGEFDGVRQVVCVNEDNVSGHDALSGKQLWSYDWPGGSTSSASASQAVLLDELLDGGRVLVSKGYGEGAALLQISPLAGSADWRVDELWRRKNVLKTKFTNVVVHEGYVYGLSEGILECVELSSGERKWKGRRFGHGQILGVGGNLLVLSEKGELALVEAAPADFNLLTSIPALSGKTWNNLCLYGRQLLIRNAEEAVCYEMPVIESE